jgi:3-deoxy-7-phosphoheptulonate synthase
VSHVTRALKLHQSVADVIPVLPAYKLASFEARGNVSSQVLIRTARIGAGARQSIVAAQELQTREQLRELLTAADSAGAGALIVSPWIFRLSPYSFAGLGSSCLNWFREAKRNCSLPIVVRVFDIEHAKATQDFADAYLVDPLAMNHKYLYEFLGRLRSPVIVGRNPRSTAEEWLLAAEHLLSQGNPSVILAEMGSESPEGSAWHSLSLEMVKRVRQVSHLPVLVNFTEAIFNPGLVSRGVLSRIGIITDGVILDVNVSSGADTAMGRGVMLNDVHRMISGIF